ncbi:MAG: hypothetical protein WD737_00795 [Gemmatimonadota bacterium]
MKRATILPAVQGDRLDVAEIGRFPAAKWLPGGHAQTIAGRFLRRGDREPLRKERVELPDGDFVDLEEGPRALLADVPIVVVLHGLEWVLPVELRRDGGAGAGGAWRARGAAELPRLQRRDEPAGTLLPRRVGGTWGSSAAHPGRRSSGPSGKRPGGWWGGSMETGAGR